MASKILFAFRLFLLSALATALPLQAKLSDFNWILNSDFSGQGSWTGTYARSVASDGSPTALLDSPAPAWNGLVQKITFPNPGPVALELSAWIQCENVVRGSQDWNMARLNVTFFRANGERNGDWPPPVAQIQGSQDWSYYSRRYNVPPGTAWANIECSLDQCVGKASFSSPQALFYDYDLSPLPRGASAHPERKAATSMRSENWLRNPDFEAYDSSPWNSAQIASPGRDSLHALVLEGGRPDLHFAYQEIPFQGEHPFYLEVSGWMKAKMGTPAAGEQAHVSLGTAFRGAATKELIWPDHMDAYVEHDTDWVFFKEREEVPVAALGAEVFAEAKGSQAEGQFDDLSVKLFNAGGQAIQTLLKSEERSDLEGWYPFEAPKDPSATALDLSSLNEAPAGRHGFVVIQNGHFALRDGSPIHFWGTDLVGPSNFPSHEQAQSLALRLARLGVNLVRLHLADAEWSKPNLFDPNAKDTRHLDPKSLELRDYLIAELKRRGIYVYVDWITGRRFREGDQVPDYAGLEEGAKGAIHFSKRLIELNKEFARQILSHINPYTGLALKDDPVYVGSEIVNESSIFCAFGPQKMPETYWQELQGLYKNWGGSGEISRFAYDFESQSLKCIQNPENEVASLHFLSEEENSSNAEMLHFLRALSPHALLAGSSLSLPVLADLQSNAEMDFMDSHAYWDHPQIWNIAGGWSDVGHAPMNNLSQLEHPFEGSLVLNLAQTAVEGKPMLVTEWNDCFPNEYRMEAPLLMAAYASLQDWDGLLQFDYGLEAPGNAPLNNFEINRRVDNEPLFQAGALIYRLKLLAPSKEFVEEALPYGAALKPGSQSSWLAEHPWLPFVARVAKRFNSQDPLPDLSKLEGQQTLDSKVLLSSNAEERLDYGKGRLQVESPSVEGLEGKIGTGEALEGKHMSLRVAPRNPWVSVILLSPDGRPLEKAEKLILVAVARAENSGQVYNGERRALKEVGSLPVLMQGVDAQVNLRLGAGSYVVKILDPDGSSRPGPEIQDSSQGFSLELSSRDHASYYLIEKKKSN